MGFPDLSNLRSRGASGGSEGGEGGAKEEGLFPSSLSLSSSSSPFSLVAEGSVGGVSEKVIKTEDGDAKERAYDGQSPVMARNLSGIGGKENDVPAYCTQRPDLVCCAQIGASDRMCTRLKGSGSNGCAEVKSHARATKMPMQAFTLYVMDLSNIKAPSCHLVPSLSLDQIPEECHEAVMEIHRSKARWGVLFSSLRGVESAAAAFNVLRQIDRKVTFQSTPSKNLAERMDEEVDEDELPQPVFGTPATRFGREREASAFAAAYESLDSEAKLTAVLKDWPEMKRDTDKFRSALMHLEGQTLDAHTKVNDLKAELGPIPETGAGACTIWGAVGRLEDERKDPSGLEAQFEAFLSRSSIVSGLRQQLDASRAECSAVTGKLKELADAYQAVHEYAANTLPTAFATFAGDVNRRFDGLDRNGTHHGPSGAGGGSWDSGRKDLESVVGRVDKQEADLRLLRGRFEGEVLQMGTQSFRSKEELNAWVAHRIPDGDVCFLVDVVSLLELMGLEKGSLEGNLEVANKVGKTHYRNPTEAAVMESFSIEVPVVLVEQGSRSVKSSFDAKALKLMKSYADWTLQDEANGVFYRIQEFIDEFEERQSSALQVRFGMDETSPALLLMTALSTASVDFVRRLCNWVNTFYLETLQTSSSSEEAWRLTTNILLGVFRELKKVRQLGGSLGAAWVNDRVGGCGQLLWATLRAHKLMKEFTSYNFSGHPRLAPYVLKHLTKNAATKSGLRAVVEKLTKEVGEAKVQAKSAQATADKCKKQ